MVTSGLAPKPPFTVTPATPVTAPAAAEAELDPAAVELELEPEAAGVLDLFPEPQALSTEIGRMSETQTRRERKSTKSPTEWTSEKQTG